MTVFPPRNPSPLESIQSARGKWQLLTAYVAYLFTESELPDGVVRRDVDSTAVIMATESSNGGSCAGVTRDFHGTVFGAFASVRAGNP